MGPIQRTDRAFLMSATRRLVDGARVAHGEGTFSSMKFPTIGKSMSLSEEIEEAVKQLGIDAAKLSPERSGDAWSRIESVFARPGVAPLWERLKGGASRHDPGAWARLEVPRPGSLLMVAEAGGERVIFEFSLLADVMAVLAETSGFVFYLADPSLTYLLCFNDHDMVIGVGDAAPLVRRGTHAAD